MDKFNPVFSLAGRVMIALIFVLSGFNKISAIEGYCQVNSQAWASGTGWGIFAPNMWIQTPTRSRF
jgi:uncharacterized membrane protein YphA (DoxX/SURF4 family)